MNDWKIYFSRINRFTDWNLLKMIQYLQLNTILFHNICTCAFNYTYENHDMTRQSAQKQFVTAGKYIIFKLSHQT